MNAFYKLRYFALAAVSAAVLALGVGNAVAKNLLAPVPGTSFSLNATNALGHVAHVMPTVTMAAQMRAAALPPSNLTYNGGPVMTPNVTIYAIYWLPPGTTMATNYKTVLNRMMASYGGHAIANINTQYYQTVSAVKTYISGLGSLGGTYTDTSAFPASGCSATVPVTGVTTIGCLTDAQIQAEVTKVMAISATGKSVWTAGKNKIFVVYTPRGLESCFDVAGTQCSYSYYCAYHSAFGAAAAPTIYANEPYGEPAACNTVAAASLPNGGGGFADTAATAARHEISEASTDYDVGSGWYDFNARMENSDKCAYQYGPNTWDGGKANYMWGGLYLELQMEWSNHAGGCVQQGP